MFVALIGAVLVIAVAVSFAVGWLFARGDVSERLPDLSADSPSPIEFGVGLVDLA